MTGKGSAKDRWLDGFNEIKATHSAIFSLLSELTDDNLEQLDSLIKQQDSTVRSLPFQELNSTDIQALAPQIDELQTAHQQLTNAVKLKRQGLLDQSSKNKKAGRSAKAYQQTQKY